jgi:hypothetical protein
MLLAGWWADDSVVGEGDFNKLQFITNIIGQWRVSGKLRMMYCMPNPYPFRHVTMTFIPCSNLFLLL